MNCNKYHGVQKISHSDYKNLYIFFKHGSKTYAVKMSRSYQEQHADDLDPWLCSDAPIIVGGEEYFIVSEKALKYAKHIGHLPCNLSNLILFELIVTSQEQSLHNLLAKLLETSHSKKQTENVLGILTLDDLSTILEKSPKTIKNWVSRREIPFIDTTPVSFSVESIKSWLKKKEVMPCQSRK